MSEVAEPTSNDFRPATAASTVVFDIPEKDQKTPNAPIDCEGESAIPQNPGAEAAENVEDDWQHDAANPRNWTSGKKWVRTFFRLFSTGTGGLAYIGLGVSFVFSTLFSARHSNTIYSTLVDKNGGKGAPEMRIPSLVFGSLFVPVGLFWYGWSTQAQIHWTMPIIGSGIFGFGLTTTFVPIQLYLVDTFIYSASAFSAAAVFRSLLGFAFPLFGQQMYAKLGVGGGNSLLTELAIVIGILFPIWIWFKGETIRSKSSLAR